MHYTTLIAMAHDRQQELLAEAAHDLLVDEALRGRPSRDLHVGKLLLDAGAVLRLAALSVARAISVNAAFTERIP
jgi:hypothetical protein